MITWDNSPPVTITKSLSASTLRRRPSWLYVSVCVTHRREYCTVTHPCSADDELSGVSVVQWWTSQWWIVWGLRLSVGPRVSVCPVLNCPMVNCLGFLSSGEQPTGFCLVVNCLMVNHLGFLFVQRWAARWWILEKFWSPGGELLNGELCGVSVCLVVNCLGFLFAWWWIVWGFYLFTGEQPDG